MAHKYSKQQIRFITDNVKGLTTKELTDLINKRFGLELNTTQIRAFKKNRSLTSGIDSKFKKGHETWNRGLKGVCTGGKETQFKKGEKPANWLPIGSERVNGDGYVDIKVNDGQQKRNWKGKHIVIWEKHNGPVPESHAIIFGDRNNRNFDIDNLVLVSRKQLLLLNQHRLIKEDADLTRTGIVIVDLQRQIIERKKQHIGAS